MARMHGSEESIDALFPQIYRDLRRLAGKYMDAERGYRTIQPTALVHESYVRLARSHSIDVRGRTHLFALAATQMRRILVEQARARNRQKRKQPDAETTVSVDTLVPGPLHADILSLDRLLHELHRIHERQARVAEMRLFSEMQLREIASFLDVSERTIKADWAVARAWLAARLARTNPES